VTEVLRLGTRRSELAVTQSQWVANRITAATGFEVRLVRVTTVGDVTEGSLATLGGSGVFATALREALRADECDLIVHSLKDLPTGAYPGLSIAAIPLRERQHDVLCSTNGLTLAELPSHARVGTGSPRRAAQVGRARPDIAVEDIRGNVDTRLAKMRSGEYDAVVLASAGLRRLGRISEAAQEFPLEKWPTSAGQGALAVECRDGDAGAQLRALLAQLNDDDSFTTSMLEREVLRQLEAGCSAPVGISASADRGMVSVVVEVYDAETSECVRVVREVEAAACDDTFGRTRVAADVVAELVSLGVAGFAEIGSSS
jgi:hydroxymethylbilane synthase